jgi:uncharacterized membrane protein YeaQ/YmgE (transglycosylase-associated protein family)
MFRIFILLVIGGIIGWTASLIMKTDKRQGPLVDIGVGVAGAVISGLVLDHGAITGDLRATSLLGALIGSVVLLAILNLVRKGRLR